MKNGAGICTEILCIFCSLGIFQLNPRGFVGLSTDNSLGIEVLPGVWFSLITAFLVND